MLSVAHSPDECRRVFTDIINAGINKFIPKIRLKNGTKPKIDPALKKLNNKKRRLWNLMKLSPRKNTYRGRYKLATKAVRSFILQKALSVEHEIIASRDSNKFFKYLYKSRSHNSGIAPILLSRGDFATTNADIANCLNSHFANVGTIDNSTLPTLSTETVVKDGTLDLVYFDCDNVYKLCRKQKDKTSSGPDGIPPFYIKY